MLFEILANGRLIGHSLLEYGDPPMGVAHGSMTTVDAYAEFQDRIIVAAGGPAGGIELSVRRADSLKAIPCAGVGILDAGGQIPEPPQVEVLGIPYPEYDELFPNHVAAYKTQFP